MSYKLDRRETYFMLLWNSDFGYEFTNQMARYGKVYHHLNTCEKWADDFGFWYMDGEEEQRTMLGLAAYFGTPKEFSVYVTNDLNSVEVHDFEKTQSMLFELVLTKFKEELKLANSKRLEKLTIREIRQLGAQEEVRLPSRLRKAELIEEYNRQITKEEKPMTKKKTVNEVIAEVKGATTEDAIKAIMEGCTKAVMAEVYQSVMGDKSWPHPQSLKKAELVERYAEDIVLQNALEAVKAMTEAEKQEKLISLVEGQYFGMNALKVIAEYLKVEVIAEYPYIEDINEYPYQTPDDPDYFDYVHAIVKELKRRGKASEVEGKVAPDKAAVSYEDTEAILARRYRARDAYFEETKCNADLFVRAILKSIEEETLEEYQAALSEYAKTDSPEKEEVRAELIARCVSSENPVKELTKFVPHSLRRMLNKVGIYVDRYQPVEWAIKLLNWAGIKVVGDMTPVYE